MVLVLTVLGGVYVVQWVAASISVWFFPRGGIPPDVLADQPMPWTWTKPPFAEWLNDGCTLNQYFTDQFAIFDTTLCGDWPGAAWESSGCAALTGFPDCGSFVSARGDAFREAYWKVNYVKYFTQDV